MRTIPRTVGHGSSISLDLVSSDCTLDKGLDGLFRDGLQEETKTPTDTTYGELVAGVREYLSMVDLSAKNRAK